MIGRHFGPHKVRRSHLTDEEKRERQRQHQQGSLQRKRQQRELERQAAQLTRGIQGGYRGGKLDGYIAGPRSRGVEEPGPLDEGCMTCHRPIAKPGAPGRCFWCTNNQPRGV